ncbi:MAG: biotin--[acetyl-CoA-carboxylase] ligase [Anaerolineae bacterium]
MDDLRETAVLPQLTTKWLGRSYHYFPEIGSTNDALKKAVVAQSPSELPAGTVFLTDYQRQGRGRLTRRWLAPPGTSLLFSILFRPDWPPEQAQWLTLLASLAVAQAVEEMTKLAVGVKWPNDMMLQQDGIWRKFGGMLLEGAMGDNGRFQHIILGIGLNINLPAPQLPHAATPPTSLLAVTDTAVSRRDLLVNLLQRLETNYEEADNGRSPQPAWQKRLITLGQSVKVTQAGTAAAINGTAVATDKWGRLLVRDGRGEMHTIAAGDVTLR